MPVRLRPGRLGLAIFFLLLELFTTARAAAARVTPFDLVLGYTYHLTVGDQKPLELSREQFFAFGRLIGRDFGGATATDLGALREFSIFPRPFVALSNEADRRISVSVEERAWLERAQSGSALMDEVGRGVVERLRSKLGVRLELRTEPPAATAVVSHQGKSFAFTPTQAQIYTLARADAESIARYEVVARELVWTAADVARSLKDHILAMNADALIQTGVPLFEHVRAVGYRLVERTARPFARTARPRRTGAGEMVVTSREVAVLDVFGSDRLEMDVDLTPGQIAEIGLPLTEVLSVVNGLNHKSMSLSRRPLFSSLTIRFRKRVLRFVHEGQNLKAVGCALAL